MAICAAEPAFSTMSPIRTMSLSTVTCARRAGAAMVSFCSCATAAEDTAANRAIANIERIIIVYPLAEQRGGRLQHLVGGADHLGIHFVGALCGDQVRHFRNDIDVGLFETALADGA